MLIIMSVMTRNIALAASLSVKDGNLCFFIEGSV